MRLLRAILIALVAVAVSLPPVVSSVAKTAAEAAAAVHTDCCPAGEPCEGHKPKDCGQTAACMLKCFNLSAGVIAPSDMAPITGTAEHASLVTDSLAAAAEHPPLPPPRV